MHHFQKIHLLDHPLTLHRHLSNPPNLASLKSTHVLHRLLSCLIQIDTFGANKITCLFILAKSDLYSHQYSFQDSKLGCWAFDFWETLYLQFPANFTLFQVSKHLYANSHILIKSFKKHLANFELHYWAQILIKWASQSDLMMIDLLSQQIIVVQREIHLKYFKL